MWTRSRTGRMQIRTGGGQFRRSSIEDLGVPLSDLAREGKNCPACGRRFSPILERVVYCGCDGRRMADDPIATLP